MTAALDPRVREAVVSLAVRGTHGAAEALAQLLGRRIAVERIVCEVTSAAALTEQLGPDAPASAVAMSIEGGSTGQVIVLLPGQSAAELGAMLVGNTRLQHPNHARSAVEEAGNILASAYLNALARAAGRTMLPSVPRFFHGTIAEILLEGPLSEEIVLETRLGAEAGLGETLGHFLHAAPAGSLAELLPKAKPGP